MSTIDLTVLVDNNGSAQNEFLEVEHGLSMFFRADDRLWLYDLGLSDKWAKNAVRLGIDVTSVDYLLFSHGHKDHTGGLRSFLEQNTQASIYASEQLMTHRYLTYRHDRPREISPEHKLLHDAGKRVEWLGGSCRLSPHVSIVAHTAHGYPTPVGNKYLTAIVGGIESPYAFDDELAVAIETPEGLVILSACSHGGVLNIIRSCVAFTGCRAVCAFIGGMHLVDLEEAEEQDDIAGLVAQLQQAYPQLELYTGHCTGPQALALLKEQWPEGVGVFYSGWQWSK